MSVIPLEAIPNADVRPLIKQVLQHGSMTVGQGGAHAVDRKIDVKWKRHAEQPITVALDDNHGRDFLQLMNDLPIGSITGV
jgi:hypothetical protein